VITDEELLAACRAGGLAGGTARSRAARLCRQACAEWRGRHQAIRRAEAERAVFLALDGTARQVRARMMRERPWREAA
jgi:hypothetical protein